MKIRIRKDTLAAMIDELLLSVTPNERETSAGPRVFGHWQYGAINPQPEPPGMPVVWQAALLAQSVIDKAVEHSQQAGMLHASEGEERPVGAAFSTISVFADDLCGVRPWPWPFPPKYDPEQIRPVDQLAAAARFQKAASVRGPLESAFVEAADKLFTKAIKGLKSE